MQEPSEEGPASHLDPELRADGREAGRDALTMAQAREVRSLTGVPHSPSHRIPHGTQLLTPATDATHATDATRPRRKSL